MVVMRQLSLPSAVLFLTAAALTGCGKPATNAEQSAAVNETAAPVAAEPAPFAWPASVRVMGDGYPNPGDPCRRLGETALVSNYLDDSAFLIGCPGSPDSPAAQALISARSARVAGQAEGMTFLSVPADKAGIEGIAGAAPQLSEAQDAKVKGTNFNATSMIPCARKADQPMAQCKAGVVRRSDGTADVTVFWPGGGSRTIFFDKTGKAVGADTNQADGSAAFTVKAAKTGDLSRITIGPERYEIVDALPMGG